MEMIEFVFMVSKESRKMGISQILKSMGLPSLSTSCRCAISRQCQMTLGAQWPLACSFEGLGLIEGGTH